MPDSGKPGTDPTASNPWTVTLCWTPEQNCGQVAVFPSRAPLSAVWGLLTAGEPPEVAAAEHGLTVQQVRVLDELRRHVAEVEPGDA